MSLLSSLRDAANRLSGSTPSDADDGRRQFFRRSAAVGAAAVGAGLMLPDDAWAGVEERANRFGITPGTVVDAAGNPVTNPSRQEPFLGEIVIFAGNFAPRGWAFCHGQLLPISSNSALFSILGTIYGGDGRTTFALPDLRGRMAIGDGNGPGLSPHTQGQKSGREDVTLTTQNLASHHHLPQVHGGPGTTTNPSNNAMGVAPAGQLIYGTVPTSAATMAQTTNTGSNLPFNIMNPFLAIPFIIALQGIFPSRS